MRDKPVQWMTVEELRDERERTRPAWEAERIDVGLFLDSGELPELSPDAARHQEVSDELSRRTSEPEVQQASSGPEDPPIDPDEPTNSA